jgi:hypothetical protein
LLSDGEGVVVDMLRGTTAGAAATEGSSGSIFSMASRVRAGDTGRLPGIGSSVVPTMPLANLDGVFDAVPGVVKRSRIAISGEEFDDEGSHQSAKVSELAIDFVSENCESRDIELRAVWVWPLLKRRFLDPIGRTACWNCVNESNHELRFGVDGGNSRGEDACGRANGGATIRRGVGGVFGREGARFLSLRVDKGAGAFLRWITDSCSGC